jgi:hypothetical protein
MKFEMQFGWLDSEKIVIETNDFNKIQIIQEFIETPEANDWAMEYEDADELEIEFEEDTEEEEVPAK